VRPTTIANQDWWPPDHATFKKLLKTHFNIILASYLAYSQWHLWSYCNRRTRNFTMDASKLYTIAYQQCIGGAYYDIGNLLHRHPQVFRSLWQAFASRDSAPSTGMRKIMNAYPTIATALRRQSDRRAAVHCLNCYISMLCFELRCCVWNKRHYFWQRILLTSTHQRIIKSSITTKTTHVQTSTTNNTEINTIITTKLANCLSLKFHDTQWQFI